MMSRPVCSNGGVWNGEMTEIYVSDCAVRILVAGLETVVVACLLSSGSLLMHKRIAADLLDGWV